MAAGHQFLKDLAEHLGIDGHLDVQRRGLLDGEVVAVEQPARVFVGKDAREHFVGQVGHLLVQFRPLEKPAVEVWHATVGFALLLALDGQALEEQRAEPSLVERLLAVAPGGIQGAEVVLVPAEGQPALALHEPQEHQAVEERLGEHPQVVALQLLLLADELLDLLEDGGVVLVEPPGDLLDIERLAPGRDPSFGVRLPVRPSRAFRLYSHSVRIGSPGPQPNAAKRCGPVPAVLVEADS